MIVSRNRRVTLRVALLSAAAVLLAAAAWRAYAQSAIREEVIQLQRQFQANCVAGNARAVRAVLADDLIYIHGNGVRHNKSQLMAMVDSGRRSLTEFSLKKPTVVLFDGGAIVSGLVDVGFRPPAGSTAAPRVVHMLASAVWIHHGGKWRLLLDQNTPIQAPAPPRARR